MADTEDWIDIGSADELSKRPLQQVRANNRDFAVSFKDGQFGVIANGCNHVGGPLGGGHLDGDYVTCPWHAWKFHRCTGKGEPGFEEDAVPSYPVKVERARVLVNLAAATQAVDASRIDPHPLAREPKREPGPLRIAGISTTVMDEQHPRFSGSDHLLECALKAAAETGAETRMIRLNELKFRPCEGYYSKAARACTWPCSITQMDANDEMDRVYDALVHWADAVIVASPIRWGAASSLYFKMAERLNCVQNAVTDQQPRADPQQGRGLHHRRRPGQHPGRRRPDARLLRGAWIHLPAISLYRAFARLVARGHGAQRRGRAQLEGACRGRERAGAALSRSRARSHRPRRGADVRSSAAAARRMPDVMRRGALASHDLNQFLRRYATKAVGTAAGIASFSCRR